MGFLIEHKVMLRIKIVVTLGQNTGCHFHMGAVFVLPAQLYVGSDGHYQDLPDGKLMKNKDIMNGTPHNRLRCFSHGKTWGEGDFS